MDNDKMMILDVILARLNNRIDFAWWLNATNRNPDTADG